jgi:anti-sigma B factor antagonist
MSDDSRPLTLSIDRHAGVYVLQVAGDLDMSTAPQLVAEVAELGGGGDLCVVVDVSQLTFIDSSGLNAIVVCGRELDARGGRLIVTAPSSHIARVFDVVGLGESVELTATLDEALAGTETDGAGERRER